jgi:group I intron endonuclease
MNRHASDAHGRSIAPRIVAVYCIRNTANGKEYIGQSTDVVRRWRGHRAKLRYGKHDNPYLQRAWFKHGEAAFSFEIVERVDDTARLSEREGHYCTSHRTFDRRYGYNIEVVSPDGVHHLSEEGRRKVGDFHRGKPKSPEHKARIAAGHVGIPTHHTEETRRKMSKSRKGAKNHRFGVKMSDETKAKLRAAKLGRKRTVAWTFSDASRAKMSASAKARCTRNGGVAVRRGS